MNIIIVGAGEVGFHLAVTLSKKGHSVCVIESSDRLADDLNDKLDARVIHGTGARVTTLEEAMVAECDVLLAVTSNDDTNLVAASLAKPLGAKRTIARVHAGVQREEWLFDYKNHFNIDYLFSSERLTAVELAKFIRNPESLLVEEIARGRIELQQINVSPKSAALGRSLRDLALPSRVRVGFIEREGKSFVPGADDSLQAGDLVTVFGQPRALSDVTDMLRTSEQSARQQSVVIFGGTEYGSSLAQMLESSDVRVRIFERDPKICRELSHSLHSTVIINADATSLPHLREEQVGEADFFVAVTNADEDNVVTCLQASHLGTTRSLAMIHRIDYADAIRRVGPKIGVLGAVSPREATTRDLLRFITEDTYHITTDLTGGAQILQSVVREKSALAGKKVEEIKWPQGSGLIALLHGQQAKVPAADDVVEPGDALYAIVSPEAKKAYVKLLSK